MAVVVRAFLLDMLPGQREEVCLGVEGSVGSGQKNPKVDEDTLA